MSQEISIHITQFKQSYEDLSYSVNGNVAKSGQYTLLLYSDNSNLDVLIGKTNMFGDSCDNLFCYIITAGLAAIKKESNLASYEKIQLWLDQDVDDCLLCF